MIAVLSQKIYSFCVEHYLRINTTGFAAPTVKFGVHYTPLPYQIIFQILDRLNLREDDVIVDIGCGKGRVLCCACRRRVLKVVGIEVNEKLVNLAKLNSQCVRGRKAAIEIVLIPAEEYDYSEATALYLYNPFGLPVMELVISRLRESYRQKPRAIKIAYANAKHEDSLKKGHWLVKYDEWPAAKFPGFACPISFWRTK